MKNVIYIVLAIFVLIISGEAQSPSVTTDYTHYFTQGQGGDTDPSAWIVGLDPNPSAHVSSCCDDTIPLYFDYYTYQWYGATNDDDTTDSAVTIDTSTYSETESDQYVGVSVTPQFACDVGPDAPGTEVDLTANFTVCEIYSEVDTLAPDDNDAGRQDLGVGELVHLQILPNTVSVSWTHASTDGNLSKPSGNTSDYTAPTYAQSDNITPTFTSGGGTGVITFTTETPWGLQVNFNTLVDMGTQDPAGQAIGAFALFENILQPTYVSFSNIVIRENLPAQSSAYPDGTAVTWGSPRVSATTTIMADNGYYDQNELVGQLVDNLYLSGVAGDGPAKDANILGITNLQYNDTDNGTWDTFDTQETHNFFFSATNFSSTVTEDDTNSDVSHPSQGPYSSLKANPVPKPVH